MSKNFRGIYGAKGGGIGSLLGVSGPAQPQQQATVAQAEQAEAAKEVLSANTTPATSQPKRGRPRTNFRETEKSSQEGCLEKETRATFIVKEEDLEKIKAVAYWERQSIKDVIGAAIKGYVEKYEQKNGALKPVSRKK